jgi:hypothetical protein
MDWGEVSPRFDDREPLKLADMQRIRLASAKKKALTGDIVRAFSVDG